MLNKMLKNSKKKKKISEKAERRVVTFNYLHRQRTILSSGFMHSHQQNIVCSPIFDGVKKTGAKEDEIT